MNHPKRRRIIIWFIILGNARLVAVIVTAISSIVTSMGYNLPFTIVAIITGSFLLHMLASRSRFAQWWDDFIENRLVKSQALEEGVTEDLLHLSESYGLLRVIITQDSPFLDHYLREVNTAEDESSVIGIERGEGWIYPPRSGDTANEGDKLVVHGNLQCSEEHFQAESG